MVRCVREIKAGTVCCNDALTDKQDTKRVHIETGIAPREWWYPYGRAPPVGA